MEYRELGKTGLKVSVLSFGGSSLGSEFREIDEGEGIRTVHAALELGINYIDCSPYYGRTKAETVLGKALKGIPRDKYFLATKVGRYDAGKFDFSAKRVTASVDESLARLNVDYLDVIQCHDIEFGDLDQIVEDTILSYCHYELNDDSLADLASHLKEKGVGIINASPLGMGLLTERGAPAWHPAGVSIKAACRRAAERCCVWGKDLKQLAIKFAVSHPDIATTLVSTANPQHIRSNVQWAEAPLDEELLAEVLKILRPIHSRTWPSGRPENN